MIELFADEVDETARVLSTVLANARPSSNGYLRANCPMCPTRAGKQDTKFSFAYHGESGRFYCLRCGYSGRSEGASVFIGQAQREGLKREAEKDSEVGRPIPGFHLLDVEPIRSALCWAHARTFLDKRGITEEMRHARQIGLCLERNHRCYGRIIIPVLDGKEWLGWIARASVKKHDFPYLYARGFDRATALYNAEAVIRQTDEPLIVVEGAFDQMWLGPDAAAVLGMPSYQQLRMFMVAKRPVCFFLDGDAWAKAAMFVEQLYTYAIPGADRFVAVRAGGGLDPDDYAPEVARQAARLALTKQSALRQADPLAMLGFN